MVSRFFPGTFHAVARPKQGFHARSAVKKRCFGGPWQGDNPGKPSSEVGQDYSDLVVAGVQDNEDYVADGAFQGDIGTGDYWFLCG